MTNMRSEYIDSGSRRYIATVMRAPLLEREEEIELARRWRDDRDEVALHKLTKAYARFVVRIATRFRGYGLPLADLLQEGNIGLMEAAARFDPEREVRFSTYASWWVTASIQDYILRNSSIVRIATTASQKSLFFNLRRLRAQFSGTPDGPMTDEVRRRIATELSVPVAAVERMEAHLAHPDQSLNATVGNGDGEEYQSFLVDDAPTPEDVLRDTHDRATAKGWLQQALATLTPRERDIVKDRFLSEQRLTLAEIGERMGLTKERIRQIEHRALEKLKHVMAQHAPNPAELLPG